MASAGGILREARLEAGLSQVDLARRAGVTQSVISPSESGARQPSLPTLERLVTAAALDLEISAQVSVNDEGALEERLRRHRGEVRKLVARYRLSNVRVFGSVARCEEGGDSDVDLPVDVAPGVGLFELSRCQAELEDLRGAPVDLVPAADLKAGVASNVASEARAL